MILSINPIHKQLKIWEDAKLLTPLDRHFALEMAAMHNVPDNELFILICTLVSKQLSAKHSCLLLDGINLTNPLQELQPSCKIDANHQQLIDEVKTFNAVGTLDDNKPFILEGNKLYLKRYYDYEVKVASYLLTLSKSSTNSSAASQILTVESLTQKLTGLYPKDETGRVNWQKIATAIAFEQKLAIITGGPGTGKTTTVTKLLFLLCHDKDLIIRLVAPTGKAAARLSESIKASKQSLANELKDKFESADLDTINTIPEDASTLHRLLGVIPNSHQFRHNKDNPLPLDLLIVDEASMVDLPMMYKLLSALPSHARLILLGDQDQLASVEAGSVLADICAGIKSTGDWKMSYSSAFVEKLMSITDTDLTPYISHKDFNLGDNICMLQHSHRFKGDAGIGQLAKAVNHCDIQQIKTVWSKGYQELHWLSHGNNKQGLQGFLTSACEQYRDYLELIYRTDVSPKDIINRYNQFRILCATRSGEFGVDGINQHIIMTLKNAGLIRNSAEFYAGRPIIIQVNDYNLGLFNGDIGVILPDESGRLMANFMQANGSILKVLPARLPGHETCFAMTVHKSQGSEFANVALVLPLFPSQSQWQLLTKELIYTAITRAKNHFYCLGTEKVFERASTQITQRDSGLADRLWH